MTRSIKHVIVGSAARTASGNGVDEEAIQQQELTLFLDITAVSGTSPTLDVKVEGKDPVSGKYVSLGAFAQKTAVSTDVLKVTGNLGALIRVAWVIGGTTPSFTFSVGGVLKD